MKSNNALVTFTVTALMLALAGCSSEGDITVINEASTTFAGNLDGKDILLESGDDITQSIYIGKTLTFIGPEEIEVNLHGSAWTKRAFSEMITAEKGKNVMYRISDDVGACYLINFYKVPVNAVKTRKCTESEFGPNLVKTGTVLNPSEGLLIQLDEGCWDFYINYGQQGYKDTISDTSTVGEVNYIRWNPEE
jgi:hypothetical protein